MREPELGTCEFFKWELKSSQRNATRTPLHTLTTHPE